MGTKLVGSKFVITETVEKELDAKALSRRRLELAQRRLHLIQRIADLRQAKKAVTAELKQIKEMIAQLKADAGVDTPVVPDPEDEMMLRDPDTGEERQDLLEVINAAPDAFDAEKD